MDKNKLNTEALRKISDGVYSAIQADVIVGIERMGNGCQYVTISLSDREVTLYEFYYNPTKVKSDNPKHTGGKKSYSKLYTEWLVNNPKIDIDVLGMMTRLSININWSTGILCKTNRSKTPLQIKDIEKIINKSGKTTKRLMDIAKSIDLMHHTPDGYKVSNYFIAKGVKA